MASRWRPAGVLVCLVALTQVAALINADWRRPVLFATLVLLDVVGAVYCFRAARRSLYPPAWRIFGLARASAVAAFLSLLWYVETGAQAGYWLGIGLRSLEFALFAAATFTSRLTEIRGRKRWPYMAEIIMVVSSGAMLAWVFVLGPALGSGDPPSELARILAYVVGDLLVLTAVCALLLGGALANLTHPTTPMVGGLMLILVTDTVWNAMDVRGDLDPAGYWLLDVGIVAGSLLITLSPILVAANRRTGDRLTVRPAWTQRLVLLSLLTGAGTMMAVAILEDAMYPWGGLVICLFLMVAAVMVHMTASLRATQALVVADPLTGLANRTGLEEAIAVANRRGATVSLLLIDLDDFKLINDAYGHAAGDTVLTEFGHHLRSAVRADDTCARIGGDEFAVLLMDARAPELVAQRILGSAASNPVRLGSNGDTVVVHASIGLADSRPGDTVKGFLRRADLAMYAAKRAGRHTWKRHDDSMIDRRALDAALADELSGAAGRGELMVYYQPIVDLGTGTPAGFEALIRWNHPARGMVPPLDFIPAAERTGLIYDVGLWVLSSACQEMAGLDAYLSVNLSPQQLQTPTLVHDVLAVIRRTGIDPARLVLEVTESAIVAEDAIKVLTTLRDHGIRIAVDDFGTGYSSLHYLTRLPVDILKIDRSFVAELDGTPTGSAIASAIIRLAQVLRLRTIAEGIETTEQASELIALGCHTGQGFLYSRPRPAAEVLTALRNHPSAASDHPSPAPSPASSPTALP